MARKKQKPTIECRPVTWVNGNVVKFQAIGRYGEISILGDPMPDKIMAKESLCLRVINTKMAAQALLDLMDDKNKKGGKE